MAKNNARGSKRMLIGLLLVVATAGYMFARAYTKVGKIPHEGVVSLAGLSVGCVLLLWGLSARPT